MQFIVKGLKPGKDGLPEKELPPPGSTFEDTAQNDFDDRFEELERRDAKRQEKMIKKSLGAKKHKNHGSVNHV